MTDNDQLIIDAIKNTWFPLERKVMKELNKSDIKNYQSRYEKKIGNINLSKELDIYGNVKFKRIKGTDMDCLLMLRLIGKVQKLDDVKICLYEYDEGSMPIPFPNMLNKCLYSEVYADGRIELSEFESNFGKVPFSKNVNCIEPDQEKRKYKMGQPLFEKLSKDLVDACEYFHIHSIGGFDLTIEGCFPVIFTDAEIIKIVEIVESDIVLERKLDSFFYLYYPENLDEVKLTTRGSKNYVPELNFIPILITTIECIGKSMRIIKEISNKIHDEIDNKMNNDLDTMRDELRLYKDLKS